MADLSKIKLNGTEYDLKDSFAREAIANIPEDKIFPVNVTLTSLIRGTSDKTHNEIAMAVNAGKIPFVYINFSGIKMIAPLVRVESNYSIFTYEDQTAPNDLSYACLKIQNSTATITWKNQYITSDNISSYETDPTVPAWAKQANKPTYSFSELTSHPTTINDYGITDAYTKTEINGLISSVLHYKGTKATVSALPNSDNVTGDVWHVTADGSEWAWDGSNWQELGTAVDLSAYRTVADQNSIDSAQNTAIAAKYSKPSSGIPKSDLTNDVQTSLGKADTALQSYTETDPVFTASAAAGISSTDISNWNAKSDFSGSYNDLEDKPTIPAAQVNSDWDATSGVAQILNKPTIPNVPTWALAASKPTYTASEVGALPSTYTAPVTSVNGQTGAVNLTIPAATTVTNTLASGTLIATINGTNVYAPAYTDADGVSY